MPKRLIKQWMPDSHTIRSNRCISLFGNLLHDPNLWHLNRRSVSGGVAVGLFMTFVPVPFQMFFAAGIAIASRVNIVIAAALCWITNPITMAPIFYAAYLLGNTLLGEKSGEFEFEISWQWFQTGFLEVWQPFLLGCLVISTVSALIGGLGIRMLWRWQVIQNWSRRRKQRRARKKAEAQLLKTQTEDPKALNPVE